VVSNKPGLHFTPGERTPSTHCTGGWVGTPEPVWMQRLEEKSSASVKDRIPVVQSVVRHYTDWATPAPVQGLCCHQTHLQKFGTSVIPGNMKAGFILIQVSILRSLLLQCKSLTAHMKSKMVKWQQKTACASQCHQAHRFQTQNPTPRLLPLTASHHKQAATHRDYKLILQWEKIWWHHHSCQCYNHWTLKHHEENDQSKKKKKKAIYEFQSISTNEIYFQ
jgi:hypothetical protein